MTADYIVWLVCCVIAVFYIGFEVGAQNKPLACPVVLGEKVVSTVDSKVAQVCVYERSYGKALRRIRL